jgi:hypothetical protein
MENKQYGINFEVTISSQTKLQFQKKIYAFFFSFYISKQFKYMVH